MDLKKMDDKTFEATIKCAVDGGLITDAIGRRVRALRAKGDVAGADALFLKSVDRKRLAQLAPQSPACAEVESAIRAGIIAESDREFACDLAANSPRAFSRWLEERRNVQAAARTRPVSARGRARVAALTSDEQRTCEVVGVEPSSFAKTKATVSTSQDENTPDWIAPEAAVDSAGLTSEELAICKQLGITPSEFAKTKNSGAA